MLLTIDRVKLEKVLYLTTTIVERRNTMPILANIKLSTTNNTVTIAATDLEVGLLGVVEAEVQAQGSTTVNGKLLYEVIREITNDTVLVRATNPERLEVEAGQARFKINCVSADEFPTIKGVHVVGGVSVEAAILADMIEKTAYATSVDETRYNINGVYVETDVRADNKKKQILRMVATDGHRMAITEREVEGLRLDSGVILPRKGIQELRKLLEGHDGAATITLEDGFFTVCSGDVTLATRLLDGQFPDYKQILPKQAKTTLTVDKGELLATLRRVSLTTSDKVRSIKLRIASGTALISSSSPEIGEAVESLQVEQDGEDVNIAFSAKYLLELLAVMSESDKIQIKLTGEFGPGMFTGNRSEHCSAIVMPMRFE